MTKFRIWPICENGKPLTMEEISENIKRNCSSISTVSMKTTCDICGKEIVGVENFINAGDKVVCSEECKQKAIGDYFIKNSLTPDEINGKINPYNNELFKRKDK